MVQKSAARKKGFTLTEVLVVVLIIAVLSAVVYPLYTKSITKSRAVEAINLLGMVRNKQIQKFAREQEYFDEFSAMGQLTNNQGEETLLSGGAQLKLKDYTLSLNNATKCMSAKYQKGSSSFTFSTSYENAGLGCTGSICTSFGDIIGDAKSVCNCGSKICSNGYTLNEDTCNCDCLMSCDQGGKCYNPYGGGLTRPCSSGCGTETSSATCNGSTWSGKCWSPFQNAPLSQGCGWNNSGTQTRTCRPVCANFDCDAWGPCKNQQCDPSKKPAASQNCGKNNTGTQTRPVNCNPDTGNWDTGTWGPCSGQTCADSEKPSLTQGCGNCGSQSRSVTCNSDTGTWNAPSTWGSCSGQGSCSPGATQSCGVNNTGSQTCNSSCSWSSCTGERIECTGATIQGCGKCGTQSRTCNTSTGSWNAWSACSGEGSCSPGQTQSCGGGNGSQTCSSACGWPSTCSCNPGYSWDGSTCVKAEKECVGASTQACGNCGTQSRTCDKSTGTWSAWGTCTGQGKCSPGATQSCTGGKKTCSSSCSWGMCVIEAPETCTNTWDIEYYRSAPNGYFSYEFCKGVCCCPPAVPTEGPYGPVCKNGNKFESECVCFN